MFRLCLCDNYAYVLIMSMLQLCLYADHVSVAIMFMSRLCADYVSVALMLMCRLCFCGNHAYVQIISLLQSCLCAYYVSVACFLIRLPISLYKFSFEAFYFYIALLLSYSSSHIFPVIHENMYANYLFEEVL